MRAIQRAGQWVFLRVEAIFNLAFGDRLNPLYYLGPITYLLMWIVVGSGLYVYAFYKTGMAEAYASVEYLTVQQWWLGGVMRSVHRYASDAMALTMVLHLARHWMFDRYRGLRWFSWVSGVAVLWLVYVAGINGYMLPWDKMAQFVVIATAEWLDWLPVFNGTLVRNFILPENLNDRLFSLLSFIHIGVPLAVMALLWIHTQRVPQAKTSPPAPIAITLLAALVVLSLIKPALSQGEANLSHAVTVLDFDWFYLPVYALLYAWGAAPVWLLVAGGTVLLVALPWLPPRRRSAPVEGFHMLVRPDNRIIGVRDGETVLDAGLREGIAFPFECRNGGCGKCKADLAYGKAGLGAYQKSALSDEERAAGKVLLCCASPESDIQIEYLPQKTLGGIPARVWTASVESMEKLSSDVMRVFLKLDGGHRLAFYAGQYINVLLDNGEKRSFSFATAPHVNDRIELQIRRIPGGRFTTHVFERMKPGDPVRFEGPLGSFFLREEGGKPIIFVAGSTGFAPVKSMVEYAFHRNMRRRMILYWGVRSRRDLYLADLPRQWEKEHPEFRFVPVLSDPTPEDAWTGRTGLVHEAILADFPDLAQYQVYACGSVNMVEAAYPAFRTRGLSQDDCFSDAFRLAPKIRTGDTELVKLGGRA